MKYRAAEFALRIYIGRELKGSQQHISSLTEDVKGIYSMQEQVHKNNDFPTNLNGLSLGKKSDAQGSSSLVA